MTFYRYSAAKAYAKAKSAEGKYTLIQEYRHGKKLMFRVVVGEFDQDHDNHCQ